MTAILPIDNLNPPNYWLYYSCRIKNHCRSELP